MPNDNFDSLAKEYISNIATQIEAQDKNAAFEIDYSNEVLTIEIDGKVFVLNKQAPAKEIWLASPISGPYHFKSVEDKWVDKKHNEILNILSHELTSLQNQKILLK